MAESNTPTGQAANKAAADQSAVLKDAFKKVLDLSFNGQQGLKLNGIVVSVEDREYTDPETKVMSKSRVASITDGTNNYVFKAYEDKGALPVIGQMQPVSINVEYCKANAGVITVFGSIAS